MATRRLLNIDTVNDLRFLAAKMGFGRLAELVPNPASRSGHASESFLRELSKHPSTKVSEDYNERLREGFDEAFRQLGMDPPNEEPEEVKVIGINVEINFNNGMQIRGSIAQVFDTLHRMRASV